MSGLQDTWRFVDLFAGCGGLSLGLTQGGWAGLFAIEKDPMAFETLARNFLRPDKPVAFGWPSWLEQRAWSIDDFLETHASELKQLRGHIDLVAGGPPCQGFSFAGRRDKFAPRNQLFTKYIELVRRLQPRALVIENVPGMRVAHGAKERREFRLPGPKPKSYYEKILEALDAAGYVATGQVLNAAAFGVPQQRPRLIILGMVKRLAQRLDGGIEAMFDAVERARLEQLSDLNLRTPVTARDAISDLESVGRRLRECVDPCSPRGFSEVVYSSPRSTFQRLMHQFADQMDSMRLARHTTEVRERFKAIIESCRKGVRMSDIDRERFGLLKHRVYPMCPDKPAPTITTLPDDVLHYTEPRILTVRESARLQSFPDWFEFCGKYTTGGNRRKRECPRYTQVGNAVPPLLAQAVGRGVAMALKSVQDTHPRAVSTLSARREVASA